MTSGFNLMHALRAKNITDNMKNGPEFGAVFYCKQVILGRQGLADLSL